MSTVTDGNTAKAKAFAIERYTIARKNLQPGDILLRLQSRKVTPDETFTKIIDQTILNLAALQSTNATDSSDSDPDAPKTKGRNKELFELLLSIIDGAGFTSAAIVGCANTNEINDKYIFEWKGTSARRVPIEEFDGSETMAFRFCSGAVALGDARLPSKPITANINIVTDWAEKQQKHPITLALVMLSIWRYRGSFDLDVIEELTKTLFGANHKNTLDLFFHVAGNALRKLVAIGTQRAADTLFNSDIIMGTDLIASIFNETVSGSEYHMEKNRDFDDLRYTNTALFCEHLEPELVSEKLRELAVALEEWSGTREMPDGSAETEALFESNKKALRNRFLPSDFIHSKNTFPLGLIDNEAS